MIISYDSTHYFPEPQLKDKSFLPSLLDATLRFGGHNRPGFAEVLEPGGVASTVVILTVSGRGAISPLGSLIFRGGIKGRDSIDG